MSTPISSQSAAAATTAAGETTASITPAFTIRHRSSRLHSLSNLSFSFSTIPNLRLCSQSTQPSLARTIAAKAQLNNVGTDGSSSSSMPQSNSKSLAQETKNGKPSGESPAKPLATEESISEFMTQVASLVKLVDTRDIVELKLKQHDCELLIRKKEAIAETSPASVMMMQPPSSPAVAPQPTLPVSAPMAAPAAPKPPAASVPKPAKSSVPPLKSPMAGTFYRSPAPGAAPFVKVGDKVQKGQVLCIIEAMKLMNEIEADQSGTVVEIIAEDGKPVSVDTPLFAIQP